MKKQFENPSIEAFEFEVLDVITASGDGSDFEANWGEFGPAWEKDELGPGM